MRAVVTTRAVERVGGTGRAECTLGAGNIPGRCGRVAVVADGASDAGAGVCSTAVGVLRVRTSWARVGLSLTLRAVETSGGREQGGCGHTAQRAVEAFGARLAVAEIGASNVWIEGTGWARHKTRTLATETRAVETLRAVDGQHRGIHAIVTRAARRTIRRRLQTETVTDCLIGARQLDGGAFGAVVTLWAEASHAD